MLKDVMLILVAYHSSPFQTKGTQTLDTLSALYNVETQAQASFYLCIIGNSLRFHPSNFDRLLKEVPRFKDIVMGDPPPKLDYQEKIVSEYAKAKKMDRPSVAERHHHFFLCLMLETYSPYHQWNYLIAPLWIELINRPKRSSTSPRDSMGSRCLEILISVTSKCDSHLFYGFSAVESLTMINGHDVNEISGTEFEPIYMIGKGFPGLLLGLVSDSPGCEAELSSS
jgi:hypothetical protein